MFSRSYIGQPRHCLLLRRVYRHQRLNCHRVMKVCIHAHIVSRNVTIRLRKLGLKKPRRKVTIHQPISVLQNYKGTKARSLTTFRLWKVLNVAKRPLLTILSQQCGPSCHARVRHPSCHTRARCGLVGLVDVNWSYDWRKCPQNLRWMCSIITYSYAPCHRPHIFKLSPALQILHVAHQRQKPGKVSCKFGAKVWPWNTTSRTWT